MSAGEGESTVKKVLLSLFTMGLLATLCCGGVGAGGFYGFFWYGAQQPAYQQGMALLQTDVEVERRIGAPIEANWYFTFSSESSNGRGDASYHVPVSGPLGEGTLQIVAEQSGGVWTVTSASFLDPVTEDSVDLLLRADEAVAMAQAEQADGKYEEGVALERSGQLDEARAAFDAVLAADEAHAGAHLARGRILRTQGQLDEATEDLLAATRDRETAEEAWGQLGGIYLSTEDWQSCVDAYTQALKKFAEDGDSWYGRALCYEQLGDDRKARAGAREACNQGVVDACAMADRL